MREIRPLKSKSSLPKSPREIRRARTGKFLSATTVVPRLRLAAGPSPSTQQPLRPVSKRRRSDEAGISTLLAGADTAARESMLKLLASDDRIDLIGVCDSSACVAKLLRSKRPDLLFIDLDLTEGDPFDIPGRPSGVVSPEVVVMGREDRHAVRAFEIGAVDYLLEPLARPRMQEAIERAITRTRAERKGALHTGAASQGAGSLGVGYRERLVVPVRGRMRVIRAAKIEWITAADNYAELHMGDEEYLMRETLRNLESMLDPRLFMRVQKGTIINIDAVQEIESWGPGQYVFFLRGGNKITSGRHYKERIREVFGC